MDSALWFVLGFSLGVGLTLSSIIAFKYFELEG